MELFVIFVCLVMFPHIRSSTMSNVLGEVSYWNSFEEETYIDSDYEYNAENDPKPGGNEDLDQYIKLIRASENIPNYPEAEIEAALYRNENLIRKFAESTRHNRPYVEDKFQTICTTSKITSYPRYMKDTEGIERMIINQNLYKQEVHHHLCNEKRPCHFPDGNLFNFESTCRQNILDIPLLSFENGVIKNREYSIMCGCSCLIKKRY